MSKMREEYYEDTAAESDSTFQEIRKLLLKILSKWYLVLGCLLAALAIAYYITNSTDPVYEISASVLVKDMDKGGKYGGNTVSDILYGEEMLNTSSSVENEIFLIRRFDLVKATLEELHYEVIVYDEESPIEVVIDSTSSVFPEGVGFTCKILNRKQFVLSSGSEDYENLLSDKKYNFGKTIYLDGFKFVVNLIEPAYFEKVRALKKEGEEEAPTVFFKVNDLDRLADYYIASLQVEPADDKSSILKLSLESAYPPKEIKFLNELTENYLESGLKEKVATATQTMNFIDSQLAFISDSLSSIEIKREGFKADNAIDLSKEGNQLYENIQELEKQKAEHLIQIEYLNYLKNFVQNESNDFEYVTAPSSMGLSDPILNSLIDQLITEQINLKQVKTGAAIENPRAKVARRKIEGIRATIRETANNLLKGNRMALSDLERRIGNYSGELRSLPAAERQLINIERQHNLSETLYLFLMEKRTESGILKASTAPDFKIVNEARIQNGGRPVKPTPTINYATAVLLGFLIPIAFIYMGDKFNNKIKTPEELTAITPVPMLGIIGRNKVKGETVINHLNSDVAEAFRGVRSNLRFMTDYAQNCKTFMVSSFVSGEGKTFCAKNLAYIFSISGKKTVYINTDLRKANTYEEFGLTKTTGLTEYLIHVVPDEAIIHKTEYQNLFVIPGGKIPPNPSELLMTERFKELMAYLKANFDYIVMDTPPRGILSDAMELIKYSDVELFVIRQGVTTKQNLVTLDRMYKSNKHKHPIGIIFNDVDFSKMAYRMNYKNSYAYSYNM